MSLTRRDFARTSAVTGAGVAPAGNVGALATAPHAFASTRARVPGAGRPLSGGAPELGPTVPGPRA
jgi:hypothetical protein